MVKPGTMPFLAFLFRFGNNGNVPNYNAEDGVSSTSSPKMAQLLNMYKKYTSPRNIIVNFNNPAGAVTNGTTYRLPGVVNEILPQSIIQWGCSFNSALDAATYAPELDSKGYNYVYWDYEKGNTPCNELETGLGVSTVSNQGCTVPPGGAGGNPALLSSLGTANWQATHATSATVTDYLVQVTGLTPGTPFNAVGLKLFTAAGNVRVCAYNDVGGVPHKLIGFGNSITATGNDLNSSSVLPSLLNGVTYYAFTSPNPNGVTTIYYVPDGTGVLDGTGDANETSGTVWIGYTNDTATLDVTKSTGQSSGKLQTQTHTTFTGGFTSPFSGSAGTAPFYAEIAQIELGTGNANNQISAFANTVESLGMNSAITPSRIDNGNMSQNAYIRGGQYCTWVNWQAQGLINGDQGVLLTAAQNAVNLIKQNNPLAIVTIEMSTAIPSTAAQMMTAWDTVNTLFDGIHIFHNAAGGTLDQERTDMDTVFAYVQQKALANMGGGGGGGSVSSGGSTQETAKRETVKRRTNLDRMWEEIVREHIAKSVAESQEEEKRGQ